MHSLLHLQNLLRLYRILPQKHLSLRRRVHQSSYRILSPLMIEHLPIEVAKIVNMCIKSTEGIPGISLQLANLLFLALIRQLLPHPLQQALSHLQRQLYLIKHTFALSLSSIPPQLSALINLPTTSLMQLFFSPILNRVGSSEQIAARARARRRIL